MTQICFYLMLAPDDDGITVKISFFLFHKPDPQNSVWQTYLKNSTGH